MATKGILKNSPSEKGGKPPLAPPPQQQQQQQQEEASSGPTVVFGQRTDSGRFISYSRDDLDSEMSSVDYHVHIPMTPDNQPFMDDDRPGPRLGPSLSAKSEDSYVSDSLFTGGFNTATHAHAHAHAHAMDKPADPSLGAGPGGKSTCAVNGCDNKLVRNAREEEVVLIVYCFLPALSLLSGQFIVQTFNVTFLSYLLVIALTLCLLAILEVRWSGIDLEEWWRNEQFWLIGGTSAHLAAVLQGLLKVVAGIEISFKLTSKSAGDDVNDEFAELYAVRWTSLMIPPPTIIMVNMIAICVGFSRTIYSVIPQWSKLLGGVFFSFWVLAHLYPFAKGLMGRRGRTPTVVYVWSGLVAITISLLWIAIKPPSANSSSQIGGSFSFP